MWIFLFFIINSYSDSFTKDMDGWQSYGDGIVIHVSSDGYSKQGSLKLLNDLGETTTVYKRWQNLKPGKYKFRAWVKSNAINAAKDGVSFWHFYGNENSPTTVFMDWSGSFQWKKIEYEVIVKDDPFFMWFRLKTPGEVLLDDMTLTPSEQTLANLQAAIGPTQTEDKIKNRADVTFKETSRSVSSKKYVNYDPSRYLKGDWSGYDLLEFEIHNPSKENLEVSVSIGDEDTKNYWSQLNYKTSLSPGKNVLAINLNNYLGERGSNPFNRGLNLQKIKKLYVIVDPNNLKRDIDNIQLKLNKLKAFNVLQAPKGFLSFDFSTNKTPPSKSFRKVVASQQFNEALGYGFSKDVIFWRAEDAQYAPTSLRGTIGVIQGSFEVDLPNGEYDFELVWDRLGYWDPSFWNKRYLEINGKPLRKEVRSLNSYLDDLFMFEGLSPNVADNPYDLYLKKIFKPLNGSFIVQNKKARFSFEGDATGVSLNRLIIWPSKMRQEGRDFLKKLDVIEKAEYHSITRAFNNLVASKNNNVGVIKMSADLNSASVTQVSSSINLSGGFGTHPYVVLQIPSDDLVWSVSSLDLRKGFGFSNKNFNSFLINQQWSSPDMNHETYALNGKELRSVGAHIKGSSVKNNRYLLLELPITKDIKPGDYKAQLTLEFKGTKRNFPMLVHVENYDVEKLDFPVGFFNLDSLPSNYFPLAGFEGFKRKTRLAALDLLAKYGFTTFSGLPQEGSDQLVETQNLINESKKRNIKAIYSYGDGLTQENVLNGDFLALFSKADIYFSYLFSDEASGYSGRLLEDIEKAKSLKKKNSRLNIGGFSQMREESEKLNALFDDGFYTHIDPWRASLYSKKGQHWGGYNANPSNYDDPRFTFGPGLFIARERGLTHYLEWQAHNNYPYFELDGREVDVPAWLPNREGGVYPTIRFMLAAEGLEMFKKLQVLKKRNHPLIQKLLKRDIFKSSRFLKEDFKFEEFKAEVDQALSI